MTPDTPDTIPFAAASAPTDDGWEQPLGQLLTDLAETQSELLEVLGRKRDALASGDREALATIQPEELRLAERLSECQQRRQGMLQAADEQGLPSDDLRSLAEALPDAERRVLRPQIREARAKARLLQHQSLTNWVLVQRTLLHLSQMIEIIATGGEKAPTYEQSGPSASGGVMLDQAV